MAPKPPKTAPVAAPKPVAAATPKPVAAAPPKSDVRGAGPDTVLTSGVLTLVVTGSGLGAPAPKSKTRQLAEQSIEKLVAVVSALEGSSNTSHQRIKEEILAPIVPILKEMAAKAWGDSLP